MPQESTTRPAPRPDGHAATRRPYAASLPAQIKHTEPAGEREDIQRRREGESERRQGEKMRTCAHLPAVLPSKSYIDRTPPPNGQPSTAPGQQAPRPPPCPTPAPSHFLPAFNSAFGEFAEPRPVFARQQTNNGTPPACLDATGTGGAFTFSRPPRFSRNGSVPLLYHVRPISPFFTRDQSRRFPNSK